MREPAAAIEQGGTYAALWSTWHGTPGAEPRVEAPG
ncbi:hypothetical protein SAMN05421678_11758 [Actinopolymorpha cephalotaxi]|uniref:Uncharacterized protein n=1 Tax=Actinopolymorpha cephalotaxi TaxID=504797 RepID=A0A1I2ZTH6_9ACTN|nr:hypothetical protein [Actinopolymorpha cephalotaxi]SFH41074.1 hypothetical protein SAMN05421678_11758 [Actinopolymorpha cephalotaxi]